MRVLVTGAHGFIGRAMCRRLEESGHSVVRAVRAAGTAGSPDLHAIADIASPDAWAAATSGVDSVIHLAARAYVREATGAGEFHRVNALGSRALAQASARAGVRRLVYVSTVKVHGEETQAGRPFHEADRLAPADPYSRSKLAAEEALGEIARETGLEVAIVRPPLVYGPDVKGTFLSLLKLAGSGLPLPLAGIENRRSLVHLENLLDALLLCCTHPAASGHAFLLRDVDLSTTELLRRLGAGMSRRVRLVRTPEPLLRLAARLGGRWIRPLVSSLQVDDSALRSTLGWSPPVNPEEALARTAWWYARERPRHPGPWP